jgi:hypothetical protein
VNSHGIFLLLENIFYKMLENEFKLNSFRFPGRSDGKLNPAFFTNHIEQGLIQAALENKKTPFHLRKGVQSFLSATIASPMGERGLVNCRERHSA